MSLQYVAFCLSNFTSPRIQKSTLSIGCEEFECYELHTIKWPKRTHVVSWNSGNLAWRIPTPDGGFFTRNAVQKFVQDPQQPGILYNHGNEFLNYQDDWSLLFLPCRFGFWGPELQLFTFAYDDLW